MKTTKKNILLILTLVVMTTLTSCSPPNMQDLQLNKDPTMKAGKGEVCENPYLKFECTEGLKCTLVASKPHIIKVCYPPGTKLEEDLVNRHGYDNENYAKGLNTTHRTTN